MRMFVELAAAGLLFIVHGTRRFAYRPMYAALLVGTAFVVFLHIDDASSRALLAVSLIACFPLLDTLGAALTRDIDLYSRTIATAFVSVVLASCILYVAAPFRVNDRFCGFAPSPTTFTTYLLALYTLYVFSEARWTRIAGSTVAVGLLVYASMTRISFVLLAIVFVLRCFRGLVERHQRLCFAMLLMLAVGTYPIATLLGAKTDFVGRYGGAVDLSALTRLKLYANQVEALKAETPWDLLLGNGIDTGKSVGEGDVDATFDQHNDFFVLVYEYGLPFAILFLLFLYKISIGPATIAVTCVYLFSFYHNMIYDVYVVLTVYLAKHSSYTDSRISFSGDRLAVRSPPALSAPGQGHPSTALN